MTDVPAASNRQELSIDKPSMMAWLRRRGLAGFDGPVDVERFAGGQSNPTYRLRTRAQDYVLRRQPPGPLVGSAHAVDREFRVLSALADVSGVPVPRAHVYCDDPSVVGTPFYVMSFIEGRNFWDATLPDVPADQRSACYRSMVEVLAALHEADFDSAGLGDFGKQGDYFQRQIRRWSRQYAESREAGRVEAIERLIDWLPDNVPHDESVSIVHGDYRCDNLMFHPTEPRVVAVLDWELSTLGHPLADLGYHLLPYRMPTLGVTGMLGTDFQARGLPTEREYVAWYCELTGRDTIERLDFYVAFSLFRLAAIFHGIRGRLMAGTSVSPRAREYAAAVERVAELAWQQVD